MSVDQIMVAALVGAAVVGLIWIERRSRQAERQAVQAEAAPVAAEPVESALGPSGRRQARR